MRWFKVTAGKAVKLCWRGGPHKALKSSRVMGELWGRGRPRTEAKVLTDEGQESASALGSGSLESGGLPSHRCQLAPPSPLCKCRCCKSQIRAPSVSSLPQSCLGDFLFLGSMLGSLLFLAYIRPLVDSNKYPGFNHKL